MKITWDLGKDVTYEILIANLGGYEKAQFHLRNLGNEHERILLQHRREHGIYEIRDKVKAKGHQFGFNELFRIDDFFANGDGVNLAVLDDGDCYPISFLEHATDAEIEANKRLEVGE